MQVSWSDGVRPAGRRGPRHVGKEAHVARHDAVAVPLARAALDPGRAGPVERLREPREVAARRVVRRREARRDAGGEHLVAVGRVPAVAGQAGGAGIRPDEQRGAARRAVRLPVHGVTALALADASGVEGGGTIEREDDRQDTGDAEPAHLCREPSMDPSSRPPRTTARRRSPRQPRSVSARARRDARDGEEPRANAGRTIAGERRRVRRPASQCLHRGLEVCGIHAASNEPTRGRKNFERPQRHDAAEAPPVADRDVPDLPTPTEVRASGEGERGSDTGADGWGRSPTSRRSGAKRAAPRLGRRPRRLIWRCWGRRATGTDVANRPQRTS